MFTLFCKGTPGLKLGPGLPGSDRVIMFVNGYADVDESDPFFDEKMSWLNGPGCPHIEIMEADEAKTTDPDAFLCPVCDKAFVTKKARDMHQLGAHRAKKG